MLTFIIALAVAWLHRRKSFVSMWMLLFNVIFSIYFSVMLLPTLLGFITALNSNGYYRALTLFLTALLIFLSLHFLPNIFLAPVRMTKLPRLFERFGSAVWGFLVGYFVCSFIIFTLGLMPPARSTGVKKILGGKNLAQSVAKYVNSACQIPSTYSFQADRQNPKEVIDWLASWEDAKLGEKPTPSPSDISPAENVPLSSSSSDLNPDN